MVRLTACHAIHAWYTCAIVPACSTAYGSTQNSVRTAFHSSGAPFLRTLTLKLLHYVNTLVPANSGSSSNRAGNLFARAEACLSSLGFSLLCIASVPTDCFRRSRCGSDYLALFHHNFIIFALSVQCSKSSEDVIDDVLASSNRDCRADD
jgi:hypothetical protein